MRIAGVENVSFLAALCLIKDLIKTLEQCIRNIWMYVKIVTTRKLKKQIIQMVLIPIEKKEHVIQRHINQILAQKYPIF